MTTYAIGDVQGCLSPLKALLDKVNFNANKDSIWLTGDLINRGPESAETIRFIRSLGKSATTVLGNHDLTLLAVANGSVKPKAEDSFQDILKEDDANFLLNWIRQQPLAHYDAKLKFFMSHAGIAPQWDLNQALSLSKEVSTMLQSSSCAEFLDNMFGDTPTMWKDGLTGWGRLRFITNAFTRMRYCKNNGELNLTAKGPISKQPEDHLPWFEVPSRKTKDLKILFGHWAALEGKCSAKNVFALDTGCCWGKCLTALCLETGDRYTVNC